MKNVIQHTPQAGKAQAEKGIIAPQPELLMMGSSIYRFASHDAPLGLHAGCWWIRESDFNGIMDRATNAKVDLGQKARWDLAVLQKWGGRMDVVVQARVSSRLWAWTGLAKPQQEQTPNGKVIRMFGNPGIRQLFLYDVIDGSGMLTSRGREALSITGAKVIPSAKIY